MCRQIRQCLMLTVAYLVTSVSGSPDWAPTGPFSRLDAEWDDYIEAIQPEYDEGRTFSSTTEKEKASSDDTTYHWNLMAPGEVPFVAILYQATEAEPVITEVRPKKACGGILVSPDTIVTPCGCIMSFVGHVVDETFVPRQKPHGDFFYDMDAVDSKFNFNNLGVNRIYVVFSQSEFEGNKKDHYLDENIRDFVASQDCYYKTDPFWTTQGKPKDLDSRTIDATLAFWRLNPAISYPTPGQFMPWPPKPITDIDTYYNSPDKQEKVIISGMGFNVKEKSFKFVDENGNPVNFFKRGVNLLFEHCYVNSKQCPPDLKRDKITCFCALHKSTYELCNGTIGWPVVNKNYTVVGLTVSNRACDKPQGSILVAVFHSTLANEVASMAGSWAKLEEQNSMRPPLYREDPWLRKIPLYDYDDDRMSNSERQISHNAAGHATSLKSTMTDFILSQFTLFLFRQAVPIT